MSVFCCSSSMFTKIHSSHLLTIEVFEIYLKVFYKETSKNTREKLNMFEFYKTFCEQKCLCPKTRYEKEFMEFPYK